MDLEIGASRVGWMGNHGSPNPSSRGNSQGARSWKRRWGFGNRNAKRKKVKASAFAYGKLLCENQSPKTKPMHLKTLLNRVSRFKSFVFEGVRLVRKGKLEFIEVDVEPRSNGRAVCSGCGEGASCYDRRSEPRRF